MDYPIIVLEGLSGTGKTTVGKLLAQETKGLYFHCKEGNLLEPYRDFFNKTPNIIAYFFYLLYFSFAYFNARKLTKKTIVFMDKSCVWVVSHYLTRGIPKWFSKFIPKYLTSWNLVLYFTLNEKERRERIEKRMKDGKATSNDVHSLDVWKETDEVYRNFIPEKTFIVKTDGKSPEEITKEIIEKLNSLKLL